MFKTPNVGFVDILGQMIIVEIDDKLLDKENANGLYHGETITLKSYYDNKKEFKNILYHEMFHALCEGLGCQLDIHIEETLANRVGMMFSAYEDS